MPQHLLRTSCPPPRHVCLRPGCSPASRGYLDTCRGLRARRRCASACGRVALFAAGFSATPSAAPLRRPAPGLPGIPRRLPRTSCPPPLCVCLRPGCPLSCWVLRNT
ncbi:hypothetical protein CgunFtcFv8_021059 [Champsocephalus gunnari]|uniref:Uncharacterized protein n=1 Tax=Champsocephalus gunnari TaxID=52237 RepID=A0AAN8EB90_CHAGU|nr:hypothetical protein CgunFtcFv8_021059 [Champsocephalus gunnari]